MRRHHSACGKPDAHLPHIDELVDDEVSTGIGQRRISYSRTDALIALQMLVFDAQLLVGSIAPDAASHLFVQLLCRGFSQPVAECLCHHVEVVVRAIFLLQTAIYRRAEDTQPVCYSTAQRTDEISQTEIGFSLSRRMLLTEHREADFLPFQPDIIPLAVRLEESEDGIGMIFAFP